jgi:Ca2+ transporting ATPase
MIETLGLQAGIESILKTDPVKGIAGTPEDLANRDASFGNNKKPEIKGLSFYQLFCMALNDFTLKILMVAAVVSIILSTATAEEEHRSTAWIEGFSMIMAVFIVSMVTTVNDLKK